MCHIYSNGFEGLLITLHTGGRQSVHQLFITDLAQIDESEKLELHDSN